MDLEKQAQIIDTIRDTMSGYVGEIIRVRANMGRSKIIENEGTLQQVHPQLFIVEIQRKRGTTARQSYQYVDVLTGMVELSYSGEKIFGPFIEEEEEEVLILSEQQDEPLEDPVLSAEAQLDENPDVPLRS